MNVDLTIDAKTYFPKGLSIRRIHGLYEGKYEFLDRLSSL